MCDHIANGNVLAISSYSNRMDSVNGFSKGDSPTHSSNLRPRFLRPQISVEQVDYKESSLESVKENTLEGDLPLTSNDRLMVDYQKHKTNSLPAGTVLDESYQSGGTGGSLEGLDDLESTVELDSSVDIDSIITGTSGNDGPRPKIPLTYTNSLSSVTSETNLNGMDLSSDEDAEGKGLDDEVFTERPYGQCIDADVKLVEWASQEFVPSCQALLQQCAEESSQEKSKSIQSLLRNLSNRIHYFCSQQHLLSTQLKANIHRGITASISTDQFTRFSTSPKVLDLHGILSAKSSTSSESPSGRESGESQYDHRNYAVKILRNVSHSLIQPLLKEAESGFSQELYHAIVQAIQKIALKVEACLSFNDPTKQFNIHSQIFSESEVERVKAMMLGSTPMVEEFPILAFTQRPASMSDSKSPTPSLSYTLTTETEAQRVVKRSPSGRGRRAGNVFDSDSLPDDFNLRVKRSDPVSISSGSELVRSGNATPTARSLESSPKKFRQRTATVGDSPASDSWKTKPLSRYGSTPFIDSDGFPIPGDFRPDYLRPKARRTTVSLSRKEVTRLGLTTAKNMDDVIEKDSTLSTSGEGVNEDETAELHTKSDNELESSSPKVLYSRTKSASLSNILDESPPLAAKVIRRHDSEVRNPSLDGDRPSSPASASYKRSYMSSVRRKPRDDGHVDEGEWEQVKGRPVDPRVARGYSKKRLPPVSPSLTPGKGKKNKKQRQNSVSKEEDLESVKSSHTSRFTLNLKKTAQALRRMSTAASRASRSSTTIETLNVLSEVDPGSSRPASALSEPPSPTSKSRPVKSDTMPSSKKKGLFKSSKPHTKSFSKASSLGRKRKGQRSGFLQGYQGSGAGGGDTETIDLQYSNKVEVKREEEVEKKLIITVCIASKQPARVRRLSSSSSWFDITVLTNIKELRCGRYTITRTLKQILILFDELQTSHILKLPERPDKKKDHRKQCFQVQEFFTFVSGHSELRESAPLVAFLMPDNEPLGPADSTSEVNFELIMTFYTPDRYPGPPGSHRDVETVLPEDLPSTPSPTRTRKAAGGTLKRGTLHMMKNEANEEASTFVIREEDKDALIVACEDERYVVVAGTFEKLVELLACDEKPDPRFVSTLLLGYRHFASAVDLLAGLLRRFHVELPPAPTDEDIVYAEKWRYVIQLRVLDILTHWITKCWPDFYRNQEVLNLTNQFIEDLKASGDSNFNLAGSNLEKIVKEKSELSPRMYSLRSSSTPSTPSTPTRRGRSRPSTPTTPIRRGQSNPSTPTLRGPSAPAQPTSTPSTPTLRGQATPTHTPSTPSTPRGQTTPTHTPSTPSTPRGQATPTHTPHTPTLQGQASRGEPSLPSPLVGAASLSRSHIPHHPVDICSLTSVQLARQLTLIELDFLKQVTTHEVAVYTWEPNIPENKPYRKNLDNFIARFNKVSYWVASEICSVQDPRSRGALIEKFIEIARQCQEHRNFNTTTSLVTGLSLVAIRRLKKSWEFVGEKANKTYHKLTLVTSPTNNHASYRKLLASAYNRDSSIPFSCIPYFGVFIRDITLFNNGNAKKLKNGLINFSKLRTMVLKFEELKKYQKSKYVFPPEDRTREFCKNLWCLSESDLYDASYRLEPRETQPTPIETEV